ncbi:MAG: ATP-binding protein [Acidimicrobiales bacterium]
MPIRFRLAGLFALATVAAVVVGSVVFVHLLAAGLRSSLDSGLRARADLIAQTLDATASPGGAIGTVRGQGEGLAQVFGPAGNLVAASSGAAGDALVSPERLAHARLHALSYSTVIAEPRNQEAGQESSRAGEHTRILALPHARAGGQWVIVVASSMQTSDTAVTRVARAALLGGTLAVIAAAAAAWVLASAALRPVERMRRQVADLSTHDPTTTIEVPPTRDEIAALAQTMNGLLARLGGALARERGFVADAGHELRTPLAILRGELELASRPGRSQEYLAAAIAAAADETDRLARLAEDILLLARSDGADTVRREPTDVAQLLGAAVEKAGPIAAATQVTLVIDCPSAIDALVDGSRVRQAVDNLVDNAIRHSPPSGTVTVEVRRVGTTLVVEVSDEGPGFPAAFIAHAFERFRRADAARAPQDGGTGLGLAIVQSIAQSHGGRAEVANREGGGALVHVEFPAARTSSQ